MERVAQARPERPSGQVSNIANPSFCCGSGWADVLVQKRFQGEQVLGPVFFSNEAMAFIRYDQHFRRISGLFHGTLQSHGLWQGRAVIVGSVYQ